MEIQLSMFDMGCLKEADELTEVLKRGSGFENGCLRIYAAEQLLDADRFVAFLSDEFNVGGHSIPGGFVDYSGKGLVIRHWANKGYTQEFTAKYSWRQVANAYHRMIAAGRFPDEKVIRLYEEARKAGKGAPAPRMRYWGGDGDAD